MADWMAGGTRSGSRVSLQPSSQVQGTTAEALGSADPPKETLEG